VQDEPVIPDPDLLDRARGALLGTAVGDALGVPYEFATPPSRWEEPAMLGGGLGDCAPGEWSDDTSMAVAVAEVAATGADLREDAALDAVAAGFLRWYAGNPPDIGIQTSAVLGATRARAGDGTGGLARLMREEAASYAATVEHSAGNGALMRTAPVALAHLYDRDACAEAARLVAELTHADPLAGDSCVLWTEAIRLAIVEHHLDVPAGLELLPPSRQERWEQWLIEALDPTRNSEDRVPGARFTPNGFTVTALQAAVAAILSTPAPDDHPDLGTRASDHLRLAVANAVRIGDDTDTVAAIAGGLLGAYWGAGAVPAPWRDEVHGWPGLRAADLAALAERAVAGG
jgi:ADP-ribosyl-[dinitrogen reductase] hydrolase